MTFLTCADLGRGVKKEVMCYSQIFVIQLRKGNLCLDSSIDFSVLKNFHITDFTLCSIIQTNWSTRVAVVGVDDMNKVVNSQQNPSHIFILHLFFCFCKQHQDLFLWPSQYWQRQLTSTASTYSSPARAVWSKCNTVKSCNLHYVFSVLLIFLPFQQVLFPQYKSHFIWISWFGGHLFFSTVGLWWVSHSIASF
jgi:hypothetical protein